MKHQISIAGPYARLVEAALWCHDALGKEGGEWSWVITGNTRDPIGIMATYSFHDDYYAAQFKLIFL